MKSKQLGAIYWKALKNKPVRTTAWRPSCIFTGKYVYCLPISVFKIYKYEGCYGILVSYMNTYYLFVQKLCHFEKNILILKKEFKNWET